MKTVTRYNLFETNSSSTHAFTKRGKDEKDYELYEKKLKKVTDNYQKLLVLIQANQSKVSEIRLSRFTKRLKMKLNKVDKIFIQAYAEVFGESVKDVKKDVRKTIKTCFSTCLVDSLFIKYPFKECKCGIENILSNIDYGDKSNIKKFAKSVFSDELSLFYHECPGTFCNIDYTLYIQKDGDDDEDF